MRNWIAVAAHFRRAVKFKHKNEPRGGSQNSSREYISQGREEMQTENPQPGEQQETEHE